MESWKCVFLLQLISLTAFVSTVVEKKIADPVCKDNKLYRCKRNCYNNCDNMNSTTEGCSKLCNSGCDCPNELVFKSATSDECVPPSSCNVICPPNMHFKLCVHTVRKTCATLFNKMPRHDPCVARCVCNAGYVLNNDKMPKCIKIRECPLTPRT